MEKQWYVVNTYSGHENKVKEKLEMRAESMDMKDYIFRVVIPEQKVIEEKDTQIADLQKKIDELTAENEELKAKLADKEAKEKVDELNKVLDEFNEDEVAYAEEEIKTFKEDPMAGDIDMIVDIILREIGKAAKADADEKKAADEQNAHKGDIFEEMHLSFNKKDDLNIF